MYTANYNEDVWIWCKDTWTLLTIIHTQVILKVVEVHLNTSKDTLRELDIFQAIWRSLEPLRRLGNVTHMFSDTKKNKSKDKDKKTMSKLHQSRSLP